MKKNEIAWENRDTHNTSRIWGIYKKWSEIIPGTNHTYTHNTQFIAEDEKLIDLWLLKVGSVFDKQRIFTPCRNLKTYNSDRLEKNQQNRFAAGRFQPVFVTEHLPQMFLNQKSPATSL